MWPCLAWHFLTDDYYTIKKILKCNYYRGLAKISKKISRTHIVIILYKQKPVFREIADKRKCNEGLKLEVKSD